MDRFLATKERKEHKNSGAVFLTADGADEYGFFRVIKRFVVPPLGGLDVVEPHDFYRKWTQINANIMGLICVHLYLFAV